MAAAFEGGHGPLLQPSVPAELLPGLDLFVATWLEHWVEAGGSAQLELDGKLALGFLEYHFSPAYLAPPSDLQESMRSNQTTFRDGLYHGKMRAMLDLIEAIPAGREALKGHMRQHGLGSYYGKVGPASARGNL